MNKESLHTRKQKNVGSPLQQVAFSGAGFCPDVMTEHAMTTFPAACATQIEQGVYGRDGMYPAPGQLNYVSPATDEGGTGGAGSFNTSIAGPKESR
jgi:hypothetical protein